MRTSIKRITPWLAALAIGTGLALAPVASAATRYGPPRGSDRAYDTRCRT